MPGILVDSSVVLDLFTDDPVWGEVSRRALAQALAEGELLIDDIVYAEVSVGFSRIEELDRALFGAGFTLSPIPREALFLAGKAFVAYRRRGGAKTAPLPDFIIGAHAAVTGLPLLTRDPRRVTSAYPKLKLLLVER
jgi:Predicted nucleic acid-binding protein, contains PIN domain